jgi:hypothetical protein
MVVAEQVQQAVQQQDLDFDLDRVAVLARLPPRGLERKRPLAQIKTRGRRERKNVGRCVVTAEVAVQALDGGVVHEPHAHFGGHAQLAADLVKEPAKRGSIKGGGHHSAGNNESWRESSTDSWASYSW